MFHVEHIVITDLGLQNSDDIQVYANTGVNTARWPLTTVDFEGRRNAGTGDVSVSGH